MKDFDDLLPAVGEMGRYQIGLFVIMCIPAAFPAAFLAFNQVFLSLTPDHWCRIPDLDNLSDKTYLKHLAIPVNPDGSFDSCYQYDVNFTQVIIDNGYAWPKDPNTTWPIKECQNGWDYDQSDFKNTLVTEVGYYRSLCQPKANVI